MWCSNAQTQHYVVCTLDNKINLLYSFIKTHLKSKVCNIVCVATLLLCFAFCAGHRVCIHLQRGQVLVRVVPSNSSGCPAVRPPRPNQTNQADVRVLRLCTWLLVWSLSRDSFLVAMAQLKKPAAVLFATDIAARGLDFPSVDWVCVCGLANVLSKTRCVALHLPLPGPPIGLS